MKPWVVIAVMMSACANTAAPTDAGLGEDNGPPVDAAVAMPDLGVADLANADFAVPTVALTGTWQLAAATSVTGVTGFPCVYNETTCNTPSGLPNGTYAVAEQTITVSAGDVLVVQGRAEAVNNLYDYVINDDLVSGWITCDGVVVSPVMTKDLIEWIYGYFPGPTFGHNGNHHGPVSATGFCVAPADGTIDVKMMTLLTGPDNATTFVADNTNLVVERYGAPSATTLGAVAIATAPSSTSTDLITSTTESGANDDLVMTIPGMQVGDVAYLTGQTTANFPSGDHTKIVMFGGELRAAIGTGSLKKIVSAVSENVLTDLPQLSYVHEGIFNVTTAGTMTVKTGLYYGNDEASNRDDAHASLQGLVFRKGVGTSLHGLYAVGAAADYALTSIVDIARQTITLAADGYATATAFAQVASTIPTQLLPPSVHCTIYARVFAPGADITTATPIATSVGHPTTFAQLYTQHPLMSEALFALPAGTYDAHAIIECTGSGLALTKGVSAGSGLTVLVY